MTSTVTYTRGLGGYSFSMEEIAQLKTLSDQLLNAIDNLVQEIHQGKRTVLE